MHLAGEGLQIRVTEPERLRDYFLRLGANAEIVGKGASQVVVITSGERDDVAAYLASWTAINGIDASIAQPLTPALEGLRRHAPRPRLGDLLLAKGMITGEQLDEGLVESRVSGDLLGRILLRRQWIFEDELARSLAEQLDLPYVNLRNAGIDYSLARMLPIETGVRFAAIPIGVRGNLVRVAFADPCDDGARDAVNAHIQGVEPVVAELTDIETAWRTVARRFVAA
jgi:Type II secretion system (T2SS), protein E, N-terminal domain